MPVWRIELSKKITIKVEADTREEAISGVEADFNYTPELEVELNWADMEVMAFSKPINQPADYVVVERNLLPCE